MGSTLARNLHIFPPQISSMFLFQPHLVYVKVKTDQIDIVNLKTGEGITKYALEKFSNERLVIANFGNAEDLLRLGLKELLKPRYLIQRTLKIVIQQMEKTEGGLSQVEIRALKDMAEIAGGYAVKVIEHSRPLNQQEALLELS